MSTEPAPRTGSGQRVSGVVVSTLVALLYAGDVAAAPVVGADPLFDDATILGDVFLDDDGDGLRGEQEIGVGGVRILLDTGLAVTTDARGLFHVVDFPLGQRQLLPDLWQRSLVLDVRTLPAGIVPPAAKIVAVPRGGVAEVHFPLTLTTEPVVIGKDAIMGMSLLITVEEVPAQIAGNVDDARLLINTIALQLPVLHLRLEGVDIAGYLELAKTRPTFRPRARTRQTAERWLIEIVNRAHEVLHRTKGKGAIPKAVAWSAPKKLVPLEPGKVYFARFCAWFTDGRQGCSRYETIAVPGRGRGRYQAIRPLRVAPKMTINGKKLRINKRGSFYIEQPVAQERAIEINMRRSDGTEMAVHVIAPIIEWGTPETAMDVDLDNKSALHHPAVPPQPARVVITGRTAPARTVTVVAGANVELDETGNFAILTDLEIGTRYVEYQVTESDGSNTIYGVELRYEQTRPDGTLVVINDRIPRLEIEMPTGPTDQGRRFLIRGDTEPGNQVTINGHAVPIDADGKVLGDVVLERHATALAITVRDKEGNVGHIDRDLDAMASVFSVASIGEVRGGAHIAHNSGLVTSLFDGRGAVLLTGQLADDWGGFSFVVGANTGRQRLVDFGKAANLADVEPGRFFRRLDSDDRPLTYGDDSRTTWLTPGQQRYYARVWRDDLEVMWGSFHAPARPGDLGQYRRTLYGAKLHGEVDFNAALDTLGIPHPQEVRGELDFFAAPVRTSAAHEVLRGTGGSLYYLSQRPVAIGSEKLRRVHRDAYSGEILAEHLLQYGVDYEIDYTAARIILREPLGSSVASARLLDDDLLAGDPLFLVVDYEYAGGGGRDTVGARVHHTVGPYVDLRLSGVQESRVGRGPYRLYGGTLRLSPADALPGITATAELQVYRSERRAGDFGYSSNGGLIVDQSPAAAIGELTATTALQLGLDPTQLALLRPGGGPGNAVLARGSTEFQVAGLPTAVSVYFRHVGRGFSSSDLRGATNRFVYGGKLALDVWSGSQLVIRHDGLQIDLPRTIGRLRQEQTRLRYSYDDIVVPGLDGAVEARWAMAGSTLDSQNLDLAASLSFPLTETLAVRAGHQHNIFYSGPGPRHLWRTSLGTEVDAGTWGKAGIGASIGELTGGQLDHGVIGSYQTPEVDGVRLFGSYSLNTDGGGPVRGSMTTGARQIVEDGTSLSAERRLETSATATRESHAVDAERRFGNLSCGIRMERSELGPGGTGAAPIRGEAVSAQASLVGEHVTAGVRAQWRSELGIDVDRWQTLFTASLHYRSDVGFELAGRLTRGRTFNRLLLADAASFIEISTTAAFRPVALPWLALVLRYSHIGDFGPDRFALLATFPGATPLSPSPRRIDILQAMVAIDIAGTFNISETAGLKHTEESGGAALAKVTTLLSVSRIAFHIDDNWDIALDVRILRQLAPTSAREGVAIEISRRLIDHLRLGVGYDFSGIEDDLAAERLLTSSRFYVRAQGFY